MVKTKALLVAVSLVRVAMAGCNADNCARAVTGTRDKTPNLSSRFADCAGFLLATVTPSPTSVPRE